jgi:hypothetical protein
MLGSLRLWTRGLTKFRALSLPDKLLLLRCWACVAAIRVGLTLSSYRTLRRYLPERAPAKQSDQDELMRLVWAVRNASRTVPRATCLTQALALQFLLAWSGQRSQIRVGVAQGEDGRFLAHAWLVSDGRILIGGPEREVQRYTQLADLDLEAR